MKEYTKYKAAVPIHSCFNALIGSLYHYVMRMKPLADPEGEIGKIKVWTPPGKSEVAIGFLRHIGSILRREAIGPRGSNCFLREVCMSF